jgi:hypothetical protein
VEICWRDTLVPYTSARCACTSPVDIPRATSEITISSTPRNRRTRFGTVAGAKEASRSRGTSMSTGPTSVITVLVRAPLRELPPLRPAASCLSYPRWELISASRPASSTSLVICCRNPPSPASDSPPAAARPASCRSNCSSPASSPTGPVGPPGSAWAPVASIIVSLTVRPHSRRVTPLFLHAPLDKDHSGRKPRSGGVELRGLEPLTPTLPVWCATSCATAPWCEVRWYRGRGWGDESGSRGT